MIDDQEVVRSRYIDQLEKARMLMANQQAMAYNKIRDVTLGKMPPLYYGCRDAQTAIRHFIDHCDTQCANIMREFHAKNPAPKRTS